MNKLKEKALLEYFDDMCLFLANHHWTKRDERAVAIRERIQKPKVTEEWIEAEAKILYEKISKINPTLPTYSFLNLTKDFIRKLVEEIHGKKQSQL